MGGFPNYYFLDKIWKNLYKDYGGGGKIDDFLITSIEFVISQANSKPICKIVHLR